jgi:hypothetical protein
MKIRRSRTFSRASRRVVIGALLLFASPSAAAGRDRIVGTWTAAHTGRQIRVTATGVHSFAGVVVKPYMLGPCTNRAGRVVWKHIVQARRGHYDGTFAGYAFTTQDPSTCDPTYTAPMRATIHTLSGGRLSLRVCYLPGGCTTWTR